MCPDFRNGAWVGTPLYALNVLNPTAKKLHQSRSEQIPMPERVVKLNTPAMAVQSDNKHMSIVTVPANAVVVIVDGDIYGTGFVKIRYMDQTLAMYAKDLRTQTEEGINDSDRFDDAS